MAEAFALERMLCPRCSLPLQSFEQMGTRCFLCARCRGLFLREHDLRAQLGPTIEVIGAAKVLPSPPFLSGRCPRGCRPMRTKRLSEGGQRLDVDQCPVCSGVWFDRGELERARRSGGAAPRIDPTKAREARAERKVELTDAAIATESDAVMERGDGFLPWLFQLITGLPIEGRNPVYRTPIITVTLVLTCAAVFVLHFPWTEFLGRVARSPILGCELSQTEAFHCGGWLPDLFRMPPPREFLLAYGLVPAVVGGPKELLLQTLSSMFLHGSFGHLLGNLYFLWTFGDNVEDRFGRFGYIALYLITGVLAGGAQHFSEPHSTAVIVGASGAISGVLGAYAILFPNVRIRISPTPFTLLRRFSVRALFYLPFWFTWNLIAALLGAAPGVAWWAHVAGFASGAALAYVGRRVLKDARAGAAAV